MRPFTYATLKPQAFSRAEAPAHGFPLNGLPAEEATARSVCPQQPAPPTITVAAHSTAARACSTASFHSRGPSYYNITRIATNCCVWREGCGSPDRTWDLRILGQKFEQSGDVVDVWGIYSEMDQHALYSLLSSLLRMKAQRFEQHAGWRRDLGEDEVAPRVTKPVFGLPDSGRDIDIPASAKDLLVDQADVLGVTLEDRRRCDEVVDGGVCVIYRAVQSLHRRQRRDPLGHDDEEVDVAVEPGGAFRAGAKEDDPKGVNLGNNLIDHKTDLLAKTSAACAPYASR